MQTWELAGYEVIERLGAGASGEVWRAREVASGELVALKRLRPGAPAGAAQALHREAVLLEGLRSPYVLRLRDVVDVAEQDGSAAATGGPVVLVLDLAGGGSLAQVLQRRGCLQPGEVVTVAAPVASALAAAHAVGLVHGDVSPGNVLFTPEGMPLLGDLGVARLVGEPARPVAGTAGYVDPAVLAGGEPGPPSDVWALAALCHTMLVGAPPSEGGASAELAASAPPPLVRLLERALSHDPLERPTAAELARALQRAEPAQAVGLRVAPPPRVEVPAPQTELVRPGVDGGRGTGPTRQVRPTA